MVTFFTTARPFRGHMGIIQLNAVRSWLTSCPPCEIILLGDDDGTKEVAQQFSIRHIPEIDCNEFGTPLLDSLFKTAREAAKHEVLCFINADIMLTDDFLPAVKKVCSKKDRFLITGRRWNADIEKPWHFEQQGWQNRLRDYVKGHGELAIHGAIDYFVFPKGLFDNIPPFANGRLILDNWLIYRARSLRVPVIDATNVITAIHQSHDYPFYPRGRKDIEQGIEAQRNLKLAGGWINIFSLNDATHFLTSEGVNLIFTPRRLLQHFVKMPLLFPKLRPLLLIVLPLLRIKRFLSKLILKMIPKKKRYNE